MILKGQVGSAKRRIRHFVLRRGLHPPRQRNLKLETTAAQIGLHCHVDVLEDLERRLVDVERDLEHEVDHSNLKLIVDDLRSLRGVDRVNAVTLLAE
ncbi:MAG: hypothetical protein OXG24_14300, partial [Gammaproteobacteria bacterium]|nr:hypothetical protein [Gammaproteobacteria bacterium]